MTVLVVNPSAVKLKTVKLMITVNQCISARESTDYSGAISLELIDDTEGMNLSL